MARTFILGALLSGLALPATAQVHTPTSASPSADVQAQQDDKVKGDDKSKTKDQTKKKDAKDNKITVWVLDATGKG